MGKSLAIFTGLVIGCRKKSQISQIFQSQIHRKKGPFREGFVEVFGANFPEQQSVKNSQFWGHFTVHILLESVWFCTDLMNVFH